jgi:hypothetical protein
MELQKKTTPKKIPSLQARDSPGFQAAKAQIAACTYMELTASGGVQARATCNSKRAHRLRIWLALFPGPKMVNSVKG